MINVLNEFIETLKSVEIKLYNEAGLQHELGFYLRSKDVNCFLEYNTNKVFLNSKISNNSFLKKEIDLYFINEAGEKIAIEIKFPTNGAYPNTMFETIKDICFLKQLLNNGFSKTYMLFLTDQKGFMSSNKQDGIYAYFRNSKDLAQFSVQDLPNFVSKNQKINFKDINIHPNTIIKFKDFTNTFDNKKYFYFLIEIN